MKTNKFKLLALLFNLACSNDDLSSEVTSDISLERFIKANIGGEDWTSTENTSDFFKIEILGIQCCSLIAEDENLKIALSLIEPLDDDCMSTGGYEGFDNVKLTFLYGVDPDSYHGTHYNTLPSQDSAIDDIKVNVRSCSDNIISGTFIVQELESNVYC